MEKCSLRKRENVEIVKAKVKSITGRELVDSVKIVHFDGGEEENPNRRDLPFTWRGADDEPSEEVRNHS